MSEKQLIEEIKKARNRMIDEADKRHASRWHKETIDYEMIAFTVLIISLMLLVGGIIYLTVQPKDTGYIMHNEIIQPVIIQNHTNTVEKTEYIMPEFDRHDMTCVQTDGLKKIICTRDEK